MLDALNKPFLSHTVVKERTTKKGKVITETTNFELSAAHVVLYLTIWKIVALFGAHGPGVLGQIQDLLAGLGTQTKEYTGPTPEENPAWYAVIEKYRNGQINFRQMLEEHKKLSGGQTNGV